MSDQTWQVDVHVSTVVRRTITIPVQADGKSAAENAARAAVRQLEHDELPVGYRAIRWSVDDATAHEAAS